MSLTIINIDTPIYNDFDRKKLKRNIDKDFKTRSKIKTPTKPRKLRRKKKCR